MGTGWAGASSCRDELQLRCNYSAGKIRSLDFSRALRRSTRHQTSASKNFLRMWSFSVSSRLLFPREADEGRNEGDIQPSCSLTGFSDFHPELTLLLVPVIQERCPCSGLDPPWEWSRRGEAARIYSENIILCTLEKVKDEGHKSTLTYSCMFSFPRSAQMSQGWKNRSNKLINSQIHRYWNKPAHSARGWSINTHTLTAVLLPYLKI